MRINVTYSQAIDFTDRAFKRMSRQTTVKGLFAEVRAFANYMLNLQKQSPIVVQWHYEDVQGMDVRGYPQLEKMQRQLLLEMLARADAAGPAYYTSSPVGKPFQRRIDAAQPLLDTFMRTARQISRKNAQRAFKRGNKITRR